MSKETVITEHDLKKLKSHGTVYICRSCKDNLNKIVLLTYEAGKRQAVITGFCASCLDTIDSCRLCITQKQNPI